MPKRKNKPLTKRSESPRSSSRDEGIFTPVGHAILGAYFELPKRVPAAAQSIDLSTFPRENWDEENDGIAPQPSATETNELMIPNAVARIALESMQDSLPQWASTGAEGTVFGRSDWKGNSKTSERHKAILLFEINWADSGPGMSWPEAYHATLFPYYDRVIITASNDSPETAGYCDFAIGFFVPNKDEDEAIKQVITNH